MRRKLVVLGLAAGLGLVALLAVVAFGFRSPSLLADGCSYKGDQNALPTGGLPVLVYGNADTSPAGFVGVSQGSALAYAQASGNASGAQVEANAAAASESIWVNTDGNTGSC